MQPSSSGANETMYENVPTCDVVTVPQWYTSVTSSLDTQTKPWARSASQTAYRMQGKSIPNCSDSGAASLTVVLLTLGVPSSFYSKMLRIRFRRQCAWGTATMQDSFSFSPNSRTASAAGRRMLKPPLMLLCISPGRMWSSPGCRPRRGAPRRWLSPVPGFTTVVWCGQG